MYYQKPDAKDYYDFGNAEKSFYLIMEQLWPLGCTYFSYCLEKEDGYRLQFYTDKAWANIFVRELLVDNCPLVHFCRKVNNGTLFWDDLPTLPKKNSEIMIARKDCCLRNGVTISSSFGGLREMIAFATAQEDDKFKRNILNNFNVIKNSILKFRTIVLNSKIIDKHKD